MHGAGGGAPKANRNALKHGANSLKSILLLKEIRALAKSSASTLDALEQSNDDWVRK